MTHLQEGQQAPDFKGLDQHGNERTLSDYKGKKLILYFYPKDNTPGCTTEACDFRDHFKELREVGYEVLGVSADSQQKHLNFIDKHDLPFDLIADEDKQMLNDYGVWGEKNMYGKKFMGIFRTTFVIDESGVIQKVIKKVKTKEATRQILDLMEA